MKLLPIGFHNSVPMSRVIGVFDYLPRPRGLSEIWRKAVLKDLLITANYGRKTRSMIVMDSGHVILSAVNAETLKERMEAQDAQT